SPPRLRVRCARSCAGSAWRAATIRSTSWSNRFSPGGRSQPPPCDLGHGLGYTHDRHLYRDRVATKRRDPPAMMVQDVLDDIRKRPGTGEEIPIMHPATEEQ